MKGHDVIRSVLITYGVLAFTVLSLRHESGQAPGAGGSAAGYVVIGLALQILLVLANALIKRKAPDAAAAAQGRHVIGFIIDGITVLLFAIGTFGAILQAARDA
jgi:hypothetical protein